MTVAIIGAGVMGETLLSGLLRAGRRADDLLVGEKRRERATEHQPVAGVRGRYAAFVRRPNRPLLWMHAPSVGEGLQARPVLELARARLPDAQIAYTYFSPSAERFAQSLDVDFRDVLPFDASADARAALDALAPTAVVFIMLDVLPSLAR